MGSVFTEDLGKGFCPLERQESQDSPFPFWLLFEHGQNWGQYTQVRMEKRLWECGVQGTEGEGFNSTQDKV